MPKDKSKHDRKSGRLKKSTGSTPPAAEETSAYEILFCSKTVDPYSATEIEIFQTEFKPGQLFDINPFRLRTMHYGISDRFSDGKRISDTVRQLKESPSELKHLPSVKVAVVDIPYPKGERSGAGGSKPARLTALFTEDHRRVVACRLAGITKMKVQMKSEPSVVSNYTTRDAGMTVEVRGYYDKATGAHQGSNRSTFPRSGFVYKPAGIEFTCPKDGCTEVFMVGKEFVGKNVRCSCGLSSVVPAS